MSAPTEKKPAKKVPARAGVKRSPRAAAKPEPTPEISDAELQALADGRDDGEDLAPGEIRPVIIGKRGRRGGTPVEMVTLFELDDVPYQIPKNPSAAMVLTWLLDLQEHGSATASQRVGVQLLGKGPMQALAASPEVEPEDLRAIFENIGIVFFESQNFKKITEAPDPS